MTFEEKQAVLLAAIAAALVEATPEHWSTARLRLDRTAGPDVVGLRHVIESPEGHLEPIFPTEELLAATNSLQILFEARGRAFSGLVFEVEIATDGACRYSADFSYS